MSRTPSGQRAWSRVATCDGVAPSRSQAVRARCVPRSRSPSVNHGHPDAPLAQLGGHPFGLARAAPAALGVVHARERVEQRVEVGHQANAREPQVVAGVHDHGHGCLGAAVPVGPPSRALLANAAHEARTTHPAGKHRDPHRASLGGSTRTPAALPRPHTPRAELPAAPAEPPASLALPRRTPSAGASTHSAPPPIRIARGRRVAASGADRCAVAG